MRISPQAGAKMRRAESRVMGKRLSDWSIFLSQTGMMKDKSQLQAQAGQESAEQSRGRGRKGRSANERISRRREVIRATMRVRGGGAAQQTPLGRYRRRMGGSRGEISRGP